MWDSSKVICVLCSKRKEHISRLLYRKRCWLNCPATFTSQSQILVVDPARSKQQMELLRSSSCQTWDETRWALHRVTNRFWVCYPAPCEWQATSKKGVEKEDKLSGAHTSNNWKMKWQKRENIHKVVLKLFIGVILVQSISDVLENP